MILETRRSKKVKGQIIARILGMHIVARKLQFISEIMVTTNNLIQCQLLKLTSKNFDN